MSFPPHDILQAEIMFYRLMGIAADVNAAIADTDRTAEVGHTPGLAQYVKVPLGEAGAVVLAPILRFPGAWTIVWPTPEQALVETAWPLETQQDILVQIVAAAVREGCQGRLLPSPFRWGRTEPSLITALADELIMRGVDSDAVVLEPLRQIGNDRSPHALRGPAGELRLVDRSESKRQLVINYDQQSGWAVDQVMPYVGASGRLDIASSLSLSPSPPSPRVSEANVSVERLAQVLAEDTFWVDVPDDDQRHLSRYGQTPDECHVYDKTSARRAAIAWLVWAGFGDPARRRTTDLQLAPEIELFVHATARQLGLADVQRHKGMAAVSGRTPVVVAQSCFSKNARHWADQAEMLLFSIDEGGDLHPANRRARAYTPTHMGARPSRCDDDSCRRIGCALEDEYCADLSGRASHPDAHQWRLC